jgi:sulfur-carrier protein
MAIEITIPTALRQYAGGQASLELEGTTVAELLSGLRTQYPDLGRHLFNEGDQLRNFVNIYVNDDDIRYLQGQESAVKQGDVVSIIPAIAGGRR